jgi:hypothetical protein
LLVVWPFAQNNHSYLLRLTGDTRKQSGL